MALRTRTVHVPAVVGGDAKLEEWLDSKGVQWEFFPRLDPDQFDAEKSLHNQARFEPVDEKRVEQYAEAMRRGDQFPPVIAHGKLGKLVQADGNHRLQAAIKSKKPLDTYVISGDAKTIVQITFEANSKHGTPTSEEERVQQALYLMDNGASVKSAAAALAIPEKLVNAASIRRNTDQRFLENSISPLIIEKMPEPTKRRMAQISTDEGFVAAVELAHRSNMTSSEAFTFVTEVNELRSSAKQVAFIKERERAMTEQIGATGGGVLNRKPQGPKARLSIAMGSILNLPDDLDLLKKQYVGPEADEAAKRMRATAKRLNHLAKSLTEA